jgi:hypothetical protein
VWGFNRSAPDLGWPTSRCAGPIRIAGRDTIADMTVRRLAAIDMYGTRGTTRRRRIILAEFLIGVVAMVAFGVWLLASSFGLAVERSACGWSARD